MQSARLSPRQLASRVGVSSKTVERWVADPDLIPHARNREDASQALGVEVTMLWPRAAKDRGRSGADSEMVHSYPYRSACPSTVWGDLVGGAGRSCSSRGTRTTSSGRSSRMFGVTLRGRLEAGCRVRFLLGDPDGEVTRERERVEGAALTVSTRIRITLGELAKLGPVDGLEVRFSGADDAVNHVGLSVFRFDDDVLVTPHLARTVGHDSPMFHLRRAGDGGMFGRFAEHAEELWGRGVPRV